MRKITLLIGMLLIPVSVMAASNVTVTATDDDVNSVIISFASDDNLIRAFGLNIEVTDANIVKVEVLDPNYRIYPSQIEIDGGEVTAYNTPYDPCDLGDANLAIEMGSLYTMDANYEDDANAGYGAQPELVGNLLKFYVDGGCSYSVSENSITGGVVMEDPCEDANVTILLVDGNIPGEVECYEGMADYAQWELAGKPECWCYPRQCLGDADGAPYGKSNFWVSSPDLTILKDAWNIINGPTSAPGTCADFDHLPYGKSNFRVSSPDLTILKDNWNVINGPDPNCEPGNVEP